MRLYDARNSVGRHGSSVGAGSSLSGLRGAAALGLRLAGAGRPASAWAPRPQCIRDAVQARRPGRRRRDGGLEALALAWVHLVGCPCRGYVWAGVSRAWWAPALLPPPEAGCLCGYLRGCGVAAAWLTRRTSCADSCKRRGGRPPSIPRLATGCTPSARSRAETSGSTRSDRRSSDRTRCPVGRDPRSRRDRAGIALVRTTSPSYMYLGQESRLARS